MCSKTCLQFTNGSFVNDRRFQLSWTDVVFSMSRPVLLLALLCESIRLLTSEATTAAEPPGNRPQKAFQAWPHSFCLPLLETGNFGIKVSGVIRHCAKPGHSCARAGPNKLWCVVDPNSTRRFSQGPATRDPFTWLSTICVFLARRLRY